MKRLKFIAKWIKLLWSIDLKNYNFQQALIIITESVSDLNVKEKFSHSTVMDDDIHRWEVCLKKFSELKTSTDLARNQKLLASATEAIRKSALNW